MNIKDSDTPSILPYDAYTLNALGTYLFFDEVNQETAKDACVFILKSNILAPDHNRPLTMLINTPGGSCSDGFAIIDLMETSKLPIATVGTGAIMSMGVFLISAGTKGLRTLTSNSEIMAHQFAGYFVGKQHELIATQKSHEMLEKRFINHFLKHTNMKEKTIRDILFSPSDKYLTPKECKKYGLCDRVVDELF